MLYFVKLTDHWHLKPFMDYNSAIEFATKKFPKDENAEVYEVNLDNLKAKNRVWKRR